MAWSEYQFRDCLFLQNLNKFTLNEVMDVDININANGRLRFIPNRAKLHFFPSEPTFNPSTGN